MSLRTIGEKACLCAQSVPLLNVPLSSKGRPVTTRFTLWVLLPSVCAGSDKQQNEGRDEAPPASTAVLIPNSWHRDPLLILASTLPTPSCSIRPASRESSSRAVSRHRRKSQLLFSDPDGGLVPFAVARHRRCCHCCPPTLRRCCSSTRPDVAEKLQALFVGSLLAASHRAAKFSASSSTPRISVDGLCYFKHKRDT